MADVKKPYKGPYGDVRNLVSYDTREEDFVSGIDCSIDEFGEFTPSLTKQEFKDECDINQIMKRYELTGEFSHVNGRRPEFGDFTDTKSYHEAQNMVLEAQHLFAELPAKVRDKFANDPANMLKFLEDEKNRDEAIELGLVNRPPAPPPPMEVRVVDPKPSAPPKQDPPKGGSGGAEAPPA